jgi:hypothetical protein
LFDSYFEFQDANLLVPGFFVLFKFVGQFWFGCSCEHPIYSVLLAYRYFFQANNQTNMSYTILPHDSHSDAHNRLINMSNTQFKNYHKLSVQDEMWSKPTAIFIPKHNNSAHTTKCMI